MIFDILSSVLFADPLLSKEASQLNDKFRDDPSKFHEAVKEIIQDSTISAITWEFLNEDVRLELTRLGYRHELQKE